ncbi:hypothetical protein ACFTWS_05950 [Streptomyces sp. NPDC057027]|uniref:hypothetical protein n=1 Tax=Streptomyces sp. NPDC057027 TaxID=3346004 RepID=UPI0036276475
MTIRVLLAAGHPLLSAVATRAVIDGFLAQPEAAPDQAALPERLASLTARDRAQPVAIAYQSGLVRAPRPPE